jgi:hypothetical protein
MLWRFLTAARVALRRCPAHPLVIGALGSMAHFIVHGLVDNSYFLPDLALIFWATMAIVLASARCPSEPSAA